MATSANDNDGLAEKKEAIKKLKKIPNIAAHHNSLLQMLTQDMDDLDIDLLSSMTQEDPALTAKILGIANSAYFSHRKTIYTVHDAIISVLGLKLVSSLLIGLLIEGSIKAPSTEYFSMKNFWSNSLTCAFITKK
ncbi:MAG: HDOD domain-containing protein, partial [Flavobacteriales bacterium]|nr:HDOD domain-containing protein [Flavobacteriales bacterium]